MLTRDFPNGLLQPARRELILESDLQNIRDFWRIAQRVHDDRLEDIRDYGADPKAIGNTEGAEYPEASARQKVLFQMWDVLNEKMPSEYVVLSDIEWSREHPASSSP